VGFDEQKRWFHGIFMEIEWEYDGQISPIICDMVFHSPLVDDF
jgi:hypothetical protein